MGVPAFFRWITIRYPQVVIDALSEEDFEYFYTRYQDEKKQQELSGSKTLCSAKVKACEEIEIELKIRNKIEQNNPKVDNLYLDMNGIIHPCCHP